MRVGALTLSSGGRRATRAIAVLNSELGGADASRAAQAAAAKTAAEAKVGGVLGKFAGNGPHAHTRRPNPHTHTRTSAHHFPASS